jgi:WD40 repeat protein
MAFAKGHLITCSTDGTTMIWRSNPNRNLLLYPWFECIQVISESPKTSIISRRSGIPEADKDEDTDYGDDEYEGFENDIGNIHKHSGPPQFRNDPETGTTIYPPLEMSVLENIQSLEALDPAYLTHELQRMGLNAGGTHFEKANRLYLIFKSLPSKQKDDYIRKEKARSLRMQLLEKQEKERKSKADEAASQRKQELRDNIEARMRKRAGALRSIPASQSKSTNQSKNKNLLEDQEYASSNNSKNRSNNNNSNEKLALTSPRGGSLLGGGLVVPTGVGMLVRSDAISFFVGDEKGKITTYIQNNHTSDRFEMLPPAHKIHTLGVNRVLVVPEENLTFSLSYDNSVQCHDAFSGNGYFAIENPCRCMYTALAWDLDHQNLILGDECGNIQVWDLFNDHCLKCMQVCTTGPIVSINVLYNSTHNQPDVNSSASASTTTSMASIATATITSSSNASTTINTTLNVNANFANGVASTLPDVNGTGDNADASNQNSIHDVEAVKVHKVMTSSNNSSSSPNDSHQQSKDMIVISTQDQVQFWHVLRDIGFREFQGHSGPVTALVSVGSKSKKEDVNVFSSSLDNSIRCWDATDMSCLGVLLERGADITSMFHLPESIVLFTGHDNGILKMWNIESGSCLELFHHTNTISGICFAPEQKEKDYLITVAFDKTVAIWDFTRRRAFNPLPEYAMVVSKQELHCVTFNSNDKTIICSGNDCLIHVYDLFIREPVCAPLKGHKDAVTNLKMDGWFLISASDDLSIKVWDMRAKLELCSLNGHEAPIRDILVLPWSGKIVSCAFDGFIIIWDYVHQIIVKQYSQRKQFRCLLFEPSTQLLVAGTEDHCVMNIELPAQLLLSGFEKNSIDLSRIESTFTNDSVTSAPLFTIPSAAAPIGTAAAIVRTDPSEATSISSTTSGFATSAVYIASASSLLTAGTMDMDHEQTVAVDLHDKAEDLNDDDINNIDTNDSAHAIFVKKNSLSIVGIKNQVMYQQQVIAELEKQMQFLKLLQPTSKIFD